MTEVLLVVIIAELAVLVGRGIDWRSRRVWVSKRWARLR